ncbi:ankyrin repeat-containing [Trichoderma arundinaceum]|uniref:Ankyrin repeat-containing n=1 Tax=Trichoderma arundinaceum TaxID=490622 RepID=A0A395NN95_TRIAR|nr:ankyrin repeat-containing [Trichoderma arundinaceum]
MRFGGLLLSRRTSVHHSDAQVLILPIENDHLDQDDEKPNPLKPLPGTCQWIRSHKLFVSLLEERGNALLWLTGHSGCGKTTLSFSLGQCFEENCADKKSQNVLMYFCTNKYSKQTDGREVLIGLILQIINRHRSMISHVRRVFEMQGQDMLQSFSSLWNVFLKIVKDPKAGTLYVILDALDECEKKSCKKLLGAISDMLAGSVQTNTRVKFLITSRPFLHQTYARSDRALQPHRAIDDGQTGYVADLERFIQQRVEESSLNRQYPSNVREYLLETMRTKADQTFLWIHIVLASVEESLLTSISDFRNIIASIPDELADTYGRYLSDIPSGYQVQASHFIKLLLASSRPLDLSELNTAFTIKLSHAATEDVELDAQTAFSHTLQGILGPLARVHGSQVSLVHQSLKEFLLETAKNPGNFCAIHTVNAEDSALQMASACIQYLLLDDFRDDLFSTNSIHNFHDKLPVGDFGDDFWDEEHNFDSDLLFYDPDVLNPKICDSLTTKHQFYSYASLHWAEHFALCEGFATDRLRHAARELLDIEKASCPYFNLQTTLKYLLGSGNTSQKIKNRSLFWASRLGHEQVVAILLTAAADPNSREIQQQSALTATSEHGSLECVVTLLADERTDINGGGRNGRSALSFACGNRHDNIVKELLNRKDCRADHMDNSKATPFFWPVGGGNLKIISTLAKNPTVNINHQDKGGRTALSWAAGDGMGDVVGFLLKLPGIDVNLNDKTGKSPLSWAAANGCASTVAVLLKSTAVDILSVDETGRNAISWASGGGHFDSLANLLEKGWLSADAEDTAGWTPLAWAIQKDSPKTVQALISIGGVEIERQDHSGRTALNWAVEFGHASVVKVLLQAGANPDSKSDRGRSAISTAIQFGRNGLLDMLKKYSTEWESD